MNLRSTLLLCAAYTLLAACSHPLEIIGEGDIIDKEGVHSCTFEQFNTSAEGGVHPCQNLIINEYDVDYVPVARPGWRFVGWENYCEDGEYVCSFNVAAGAVRKSWGKVLPPLIAHFEQASPPGEFLRKVLGVGASAAIYKSSDNSFLLTTSGGDESSQNALLRMDSITGQVETLALLPYQGHVLELSADEKTLYIAYSDKNQIDIFDLESPQVTASINLVGEDGVTGLIARSISASPTDPGVIAVSLGWGINFALASLYRDGVQFGESTYMKRGDVWRGEVEFALDGTVLYGEGITTMAVTEEGLGEAIDAVGHFGAPTFVGDMAFSFLTALDPATLSPIGVYRAQDYSQGINTHVAYAPELDFVFSYFPYDNRLLVNDARRYTPVADYALTIDGSFVGMHVSTDSVLLLSNSSVYLIAKDDIQPMYTQGCPIQSLDAVNGKPYLRLDCPFTDVVYDPFRSKVYAGVRATLGQNGNSIAVIDVQTGLIEKFIPAVSEPENLALNADGTKLFIGSEVSSFVSRLDILSEVIDGEYWLGSPGEEDHYPVLELLAHPVDPAMFVIVLGNSGHYERLSLVSNLSYIDSFILGFSYPYAEFATDGSLVAKYVTAPQFNLVIGELDVSPSGFSSVIIGEPEVDVDSRPFTTHGDSLIFTDGMVLDRATLVQQTLLPFSEMIDRFAKIAVDRDSDTLFHVGDRYNQTSYLQLDRFDLETGNLIAELGLSHYGIHWFNLLSLLPVEGENILLHIGGSFGPETHLYFLKDSDFDPVVP